MSSTADAGRSHIRPALVAASAILVGIVGTACKAGMSSRSLTVPEGATAASQSPDIAIDPSNGDVLLTWIAISDERHPVFFSRSSDGGVSWTAPVAVTGAGDSVYAQEESPPVVMVSQAGVVGVAWSNLRASPGKEYPDADIRFSRSSDGGRTWSPAVILNDDTAGAPSTHKFHGATWVGDSTFVVAWLDGRRHPRGAFGPRDPLRNQVSQDDSADIGIYSVVSSDLGRTWGPNTPRWPSICGCCRVKLAGLANGEPVAVWRHRFPGEMRETIVARLSDAPAVPKPVRRDDWHYPGCPDAGPDVAIDRTGRAHVAWYTGRNDSAGIYYTRASAAQVVDRFEPATVVATGAMPITRLALAVLHDGQPLVVFDRDVHGRAAVTAATLGANGRVTTAGIAARDGVTRPKLAALPAGGAVVVWTEHGDTTSRIHLAQVHRN